MHLDCDVLVVGAGPAGAAVARHLAANGLDVALADRKDFPRPKPCGDFVGPGCAPLLRELGVFERLLAAGARPLRGIDLCGHGVVAEGRHLALPGDAGSVALGVRRETLDLELLAAARAAGARWLPRHELRSLTRDATGAVVGALLRGPDLAVLAVHARLVVGADGVRSKVARDLGVQRRRTWLDRFALVARWSGAIPRSVAEAHVFPGGYFAAASVDGGELNLNLVVDREALATRGDGDWDAFAAERLRQAPALVARLASSRRVSPWRGTGPLAFRTTRQVVPGCALAGDAFGYVDPFTGDGVLAALRSARLLAGFLLDGRALDRAGEARVAPKALLAYARAHRRQTGPRQLLAGLLQRGLRRPFVAGALLRACEWSPAVADLFVSLAGGAIEPRDLRRPSFWRAFTRSRAAMSPPPSGGQSRRISTS